MYANPGSRYPTGQSRVSHVCLMIIRQGSKSVLDYFSDVSDVVKMLVQLTPKYYAGDIAILANLCHQFL